MNNELQDFLGDIITLLQDKYNESLAAAKKTKAEADAAFEQGRYIAYYDVLELISSQLSAFGYKFPQARLIVPELGKPL